MKLTGKRGVRNQIAGIFEGIYLTDKYKISIIQLLALNTTILAHNHPSGVCEPSQADIRITERLKKALALVDIRVLDHVIVGDETTCLSEQGLV